MANKTTGTFVDDNRLRPRDNSGGPMGPAHSTDFGETGASVTTGEAGPEMGTPDEMTMGQRGTMKNPKRNDPTY
jgi:hypothetical protein